MQIEDEAAEALAEKSVPSDELNDIVIPSTVVGNGKHNCTRAVSYDSTMTAFELELAVEAVPIS